VGTVPIEVLYIGFGNVVLRSRIVAILSARSSKDSKAVFSEPMKRLRTTPRRPAAWWTPPAGAALRL